MQQFECKPLNDQEQIDRDYKAKKNQTRLMLVLVFVFLFMAVAWMVWQEWRLRVAYQENFLDRTVQMMASQLYRFLSGQEARFRLFSERAEQLLRQQTGSLEPIERYQKTWQQFLATRVCSLLREIYPHMLGAGFYAEGLYMVPEGGICGNNESINLHKSTLEGYIRNDFASEERALVSVHFLKKPRRQVFLSHALKLSDLYQTVVFRWKMPSYVFHQLKDVYVIMLWPAHELEHVLYGHAELDSAAYRFEIVEKGVGEYRRSIPLGQGTPRMMEPAVVGVREQCDERYGTLCVAGYLLRKEYWEIVLWGAVMTVVFIFFIFLLWRVIGDLYDDLRDARKTIKQYEGRDKITGLYTLEEAKKKFCSGIEKGYWKDCKEGYHGVCILDVDYLRKINSTYHYTTGDRIMKALAEKCIEWCEGSLKKKALGLQVIMARLGGDTIVAIFPCIAKDEKTGYANLKEIAESLRDAGEFEYSEHTDEKTIRTGVTVSIGAALVKADAHFDDLLNAADPWVDTAKRAGRNCCRIRGMHQLSQRQEKKDPDERKAPKEDMEQHAA